MVTPTTSAHDVALREGMEGLIAVMKDRKRVPSAAPDSAVLASVATMNGDDVLANAPWSAVETSTSGPMRPLERGAVVGRYVVLQRLGAGAMGVVYAAYDPELDRKVALKLLLPGVGGENGGTRLLREAQTLAKLAHPNVVAIHDVGTMGEQVWIAMEFVRGQTLREWLAKPRRWPEVVKVMRSAGDGLAAAHEAGLLHRDFKPDNVMIGDDGRVRVMDFGLARLQTSETKLEPEASNVAPTLDTLALQVTRAGTMVGTPSYMAPEQLDGAELSAATDQFAFCVTLWEALYGERPFAGRSLEALAVNVIAGKLRPPPKGRRVPAWLQRACERGLVPDPRKRWPSMQALLDELRKRATPRYRWLSLGLTGGLAALGGGLALARYVEVMDRCTGARAQLEGIWDDARRQEVQDAILGTELPYASDTWDRVQQRLDAHAEAWANKHTEVCEATRVTETQTEAAMELRMGCLYEHKRGLGATTSVLAEADATAVEKAVELVAGLPQLDRCDDVARLEAQRQRMPPPEDPEVAQEVEALRERLAKLAAQQAAGKHTGALEEIEPVVARAQELGYPPLLVEARFRRGELLEDDGKYTAAEHDLSEAYVLALRHRHDEVALRSVRSLTFVVGAKLSRHAEGFVWGRTAVALAEQLDDGLALAASMGTVGSVLHGQGKYAEARTHHERALALKQELLEPDDLRIAKSLGSLASVHKAQGDLEQAMQLNERALQITVRALGEDHPQVALWSGNLGNVLFNRGDHDRAMIHHERALRIYEAALGPAHPDVARSLNNLGLGCRHQGRYEQAKQYFERALGIYERTSGSPHPEQAAVLENLGALLFKEGSHEQALLLFQRVLHIREATLGPSHPDLAGSLHNLAFVAGYQGDYARATAYLEHAVGIKEAALGPAHPRVAESLHLLAEAKRLQDEPEQAIALLERASSIVVAALGPDHSSMADIELGLGSAWMAQAKYTKAEPHLQRALRIREQSLGVDHPELVLTLVSLAKTALAQRHYDAAQAHAERAVRLGEARDAQPEQLADARFELARALWYDRSQRARARGLAQQARDVFAKAGTSSESQLAEVEAWVVEHHR